jgi:hypothetical protein
MSFLPNGSPAIASIGAVLTALWFATPSPARAADGPDKGSVAKQAAELTFPQSRQIVEKNLKANPRYRDGDLIVRGDVEPIFNELLGLGYVPADSEALYDAFLPDMAPLIQVLRSETGRKFMLQIRDIKGAYDRLERLSWLPRGPLALGQLVNAEDAVEKLRMLTTPAGAAAIRKQFPDDSRAQNFDRPTGHIHTAAQLLDHLQEIHRQKTAAQ